MNNSKYKSVCIILGFLLTFSACTKKQELYSDKGHIYFTSSATMAQMSPVPTTASNATAEFFGRFDNNSKVFNYRLKWKDMSSLVTRADFYFPSTRVQNGWLQRNIFTTTTPRAVADSITGYIYSNSSLTDDEIAAMKAGQVYVQIVTQLNTGGEIRGYLVKTEDTTK